MFIFSSSGTAECNSLPHTKNDLQRTTSANVDVDVESQRMRKNKGKRRNFTFPSIHFSFPKFGGGKKMKSPGKDINSKAGVSLNVDDNGDVFVEGDAKSQSSSVDVPDVQMEVVEEVEIKAEVKRPDVDDISGKLAILGRAGINGDTGEYFLYSACVCMLVASRPVARGVRRTTPNLPKGPLFATKWAKNGVL